MTASVLVAGATGNLGLRIVRALQREGADVWALARAQSDPETLATLETLGVKVVRADLGNEDDLVASLRGADVVVSALNGLRPVIVDGQSALLAAAVKAGVKRFIPSDYAADFTRTAGEENRNFDLRREFAAIADAAPIEVVSVLNGMFTDLLAWGNPLLDLRKQSTTYWGEADQVLDFTTMVDTAAVTAQAALMPQAQRWIRVAGDSLDATALAQVGTELTGQTFALNRAGSIAELSAAIEATRAADPGGENEEFPRWQQMQYIRNMSSGKAQLTPLDNAKFPNVRWLTVRDVVAQIMAGGTGGR